jgi:RHS repeat-associated protein
VVFQCDLTTKIFFDSNTIEYIYNATGQKLQKKVTQGATITTTEYLTGFQYQGNVLQFFPHAEGYVNNTAGVYNYVFNYTDHLGNVRLSYTKNTTTGVLNILEESHYYPFGLKHSGYNSTVVASSYKYKYNGKELQDELGLNMYDYENRNYDPAIGRWMSIDPLAEQGRRWSPYNYAMNNPIYFIDPDGMLSQSFIDDLLKKSGSGETKWTNNNNGSFSSNTGESADTGESTNEPPVNVFTFMKNDIFNNVFNEANKKGNYKEGDGVFSVFGHGGPGYINNHNDKWSRTNAQSAIEFDDMMKTLSSAYGKFAKNLKASFTLTLYSCQSATSAGEGYSSIAQQISIRHPNATIIGFDGFAIYDRENNKPAITMISTDIKLKGNVMVATDNKGYIVTFKGGKEIKRELYTEYKNRIKK